jgi:hypothetical protein
VLAVAFSALAFGKASVEASTLAVAVPFEVAPESVFVPFLRMIRKTY